MKFSILFLVCFLLLSNVHANQCVQLFASEKSVQKNFKSLYPDHLVDAPNEIIRYYLIREYLRFSRERARTPSVEQFAVFLDFRKESLQALLHDSGLETMDKLKKEAYSFKPKTFKNVRDKDYFNKEYSLKLLEEAKNHSTILITSAKADKMVDRDAFKALLKMAEEKDAVIWVIPLDGQTTFLDPILYKTSRVRILTHSVQLSEYLTIRNTVLSTSVQNPLMSTDKLGKRGEVTIFGSEKIHVRTLATKNNHVLQHIQYTTGTITTPHLLNAKVVENKSNALAQEHHRLGVIVLEKTFGQDHLIQERTQGHWNVRVSRYVEEVKGFSDLGKIYKSSGVGTLKYEAINPGDIHILKTDPRVLNGLIQLISTLKGLKYFIAHDPFDGKSISHWDAKDYIKMVEKVKSGEINLKEELLWNVAFYNRLLAENPQLKIIIPSANHNSWVSRWIRDRRFEQDLLNRQLGESLIKQMLSTGKDPYEIFILKHVDNPRRIIFVDADQSYKIGPPHRSIDVSNHGDKGANGARGSIKSYETGYDSTMYGHTHRYEERGSVFNIGTSTYLLMDYNRDGLNSWVQAVGLIDQFGQAQVLIFRDGEWYTQNTKEELRSKEFFGDFEPRLLPNLDEKSQDTRIKTTFDLEE